MTSHWRDVPEGGGVWEEGDYSQLQSFIQNSGTCTITQPVFTLHQRICGFPKTSFKPTVCFNSNACHQWFREGVWSLFCVLLR